MNVFLETEGKTSIATEAAECCVSQLTPFPLPESRGRIETEGRIIDPGRNEMRVRVIRVSTPSCTAGDKKAVSDLVVPRLCAFAPHVASGSKTHDSHKLCLLPSTKEPIISNSDNIVNEYDRFGRGGYRPIERGTNREEDGDGLAELCAQ